MVETLFLSLSPKILWMFFENLLVIYKPHEVI